MKLDGKRILITGGGRGVGYEIARTFAAQGARVAICGRNMVTLINAQANIDGHIIPIEADLADPLTPQKLAQNVKDALGGLDILVNNAGVQLNYSFFDRDYDDLTADIDHEFQINLLSPIKLAAAVLPMLADSKSPAILNVGSGLALAPKTSAAIYCASKAGLRSFSRTLGYQAETAAPKLRVIDVVLPIVDTDMTAGRGSGKISPRKVAKTVLKGLRRGRTEVLVGKTGIFSLIMRVAPKFGYGILKGG